MSGEGPMLQAESGRQPGAVQRVRRLLGRFAASVSLAAGAVSGL